MTDTKKEINKWFSKKFPKTELYLDALRSKNSFPYLAFGMESKIFLDNCSKFLISKNIPVITKHDCLIFKISDLETVEVTLKQSFEKFNVSFKCGLKIGNQVATLQPAANKSFLIENLVPTNKENNQALKKEEESQGREHSSYMGDFLLVGTTLCSVYNSKTTRCCINVTEKTKRGKKYWRYQKKGGRDQIVLQSKMSKEEFIEKILKGKIK
jgi:hypothetical protein